MASRRKLNSRARGFTLIELLVVLVVLALIIGSAESSYNLFLSQMSERDAGAVYVQMLRQAQTFAQASRADSAWGVEIDDGSITVYQGSSYATRVTSYDEPYNSSLTFTVSGVEEVNFAKFTGLPNTSGTTTITAYGATPENIYINAKGNITY